MTCACVCVCYVVCKQGRWWDEERKAEAELQHGTFFRIVKGLEAHLRMTAENSVYQCRQFVRAVLKVLFNTSAQSTASLSTAAFSSIRLIKEAAFQLSAYNHFHYSSQIIALKSH